MACTKAYGFTVEKIDWSNPNELEPYCLAYNYERRQNDELLWIMGQYVGYAIGTMFKGKYPDKPILEEVHSQSNEYEIKKQRELLAARLENMARNWRLTHKDAEDSGSNEE